MKNLLHVRDLDDLHLAADSLFSAEALLLSALQIVVGEHPGVAAGADFISDVHGVTTQIAVKRIGNPMANMMPPTISERGMVLITLITFCILFLLLDCAVQHEPCLR